MTLRLIEGDILLQTADKRRVNEPVSRRLCHENAEAYQRRAVSAKCQVRECGNKGFVWNGFDETLRLCARHLRGEVIDLEKFKEKSNTEPVEKPVELPQAEKMPDTQIPPTQSCETQLGEFARKTQKWKEDFAKSIQSTLNQHLTVSSSSYTDDTNHFERRQAETRRNAKEKITEKESESDGTTSTSGPKKSEKPPSIPRTDSLPVSNSSEESEDSVEWEFPKRAFGKQPRDAPHHTPHQHESQR